MSHMRKDYGGVFGVAFILAILIIVLLGVKNVLHGFEHALDQQTAQSWDQENLKRTDHGCPTAIYVAPNGTLVQCQEHFRIYTIKPLFAPPEFSTIEQAAIAGLKAIAAKPTSPYYEWGGKIVQMPDGQFAALAANTSYEGDTVSIRSNDFGLNAVTVGDYHTHPCLPEHYIEYFSPEDLGGSIFYRRTVFMGDFCTGHVHEFKPGDRPDVEHPSGGDAHFYATKGRIIGQFTTPHTLMVAE